MDKFFLHRIQKENGNFSKGIEVHNTLDSALLSFWGRLKLAYGKNPAITYMFCMITDGSGQVVQDYRKCWIAEGEEENTFFLHHIRQDGEVISKDIDVLETLDAAMSSFAGQMEYGYGNPKYAGVSFVSCVITDLLSGGMRLQEGVWNKPEEQPQPEVELSE